MLDLYPECERMPAGSHLYLPEQPKLPTHNELIRLLVSRGLATDCTHSHRIRLYNGVYIPYRTIRFELKGIGEAFRHGIETGIEHMSSLGNYELGEA